MGRSHLHVDSTRLAPVPTFHPSVHQFSRTVSQSASVQGLQSISLISRRSCFGRCRSYHHDHHIDLLNQGTDGWSRAYSSGIFRGLYLTV